MTGDKGPSNWDGYVNLNCSFDDLFTQANYDNNEDAYNDAGINQTDISSLIAYVSQQGAAVNFSLMSLFVANLHTQGTVVLKWNVYSCCCNSGSDATYTYQCVNDPSGPFSTLPACETVCAISGTPVVSGCTDVTAANYNANAQTDDGSCIYTWGCQPGEELTNSCSSRGLIGNSFTTDNSVIDFFADPNNYSQYATTTLYKVGMTGKKTGANDCLSYSNDIFFSIGNLNVNSTKGTVFSGTTWDSLIKFLIKQGISVTLSMTRSQVITAINSTITNYTISIDLKRCYCTHGPCLCEADVNGTYSTEKACKDEKTNCCT